MLDPIKEKDDISVDTRQENQVVDSENFNGVFKEDFSIPTYDEYEDGHLDSALEEPGICNNILDHLEEDEGPELDISSCSSNSKSSCQ